MPQYKDWKGNSVSYAKTIGSSEKARQSRHSQDYYATEPKAAKLLFQIEHFDGAIWECV